MEKSIIIPIHISRLGVWVGITADDPQSFGTEVPVPYFKNIKANPTVINLPEKMAGYIWTPYRDVIETPSFSLLPENCKSALLSLKPISDYLMKDIPSGFMRRKFQDIYDTNPKFDRPIVYMDATWIAGRLYVWRWNTPRAPFADTDYVRIPRHDYVLYTRYCLPIDHPHGVWEAASMRKYETRKHIKDAVAYCERLYEAKLSDPYSASDTAYGGDLSSQNIATPTEAELRISTMGMTLARMEETIPYISLLNDESYQKVAKKINHLLEKETDAD